MSEEPNTRDSKVEGLIFVGDGRVIRVEPKKGTYPGSSEEEPAKYIRINVGKVSINDMRFGGVEATEPHPLPAHGGDKAPPIEAVKDFGDFSELYNSFFHPQMNTQPEPPVHARSLLLMFLPREVREATAGDLEEMFREDLKTYGLEGARKNYWGQVLRSVVPVFLKWIGELLKIWLAFRST